MKRIFRLLLVVAAFCALAGCGSSVNKKEVAEYLKAANPDSSALLFYTYDGSTTTRRVLYDKDSKEEILKDISKLSALPVADWTPSKGDVPFYGIIIGGDNGDLEILFAGGYAILADGRTYKMSYSFQGYEGRYAWQDMDYFGGMAMPCAYFATLGSSGWNRDLLNESDAVVNDRIVVTRTGENNGIIDVEITNNMGMNWFFGDYWHLEVKLEDTWYRVPSKEPVFVNDIGHELAMGQSMKKSYDMNYYGELPSGRYRLIIDGSDVQGALEIDR